MDLMAINFMNMPAAQYPRSALLDLAPLAGAISDYGQGVQAVAKNDARVQIGQTAANQGYAAAGREAMSKGELDAGLKFAQEGDAQRDRLVKRYGVLAQKIDQEQDPALRARMHTGFLGRWKREMAGMGINGEFDPDEMDPMTGPKLFMAQAGIVSDPLDQETKRARLNLIRAQTQAAQTKGNAAGSREQMLIDNGIDPKSAEGKAFLLTGKLPAAAYQNIAQEQRKTATASKIAEGLRNLNSMTDQYNDASFVNSLGPIQGSVPDSLLGAIPVNAARLFGEVANYAEGGNARPNEVRNNIVGNTEALAAAIKPLIRGPGEGVWTDADQARLVSIVGDLAQASDKAEFKRRLNAVRDRVKANFGLDIPFDALVGEGAKALEQRGPQPFVQNGWSIQRVD